MPTNAEIVVEIKGKVEDYKRKLVEMTGATQDAADKAGKALQKSLFDKAARDAAGVGKSNEAAAAAVTRAWTETGKKLGEVAGGKVATLSNALFELVPKANAAAGAVGGIAVAAVGLAAGASVVYGLATAIVGVANAASDASKSLRDAGAAELISSNDQRQIEEYDRSTKALRQSVQALTVNIGADVAEALGLAARAGTAWLDVVLRTRQSIDDAIPSWARWTTYVHGAIDALGGIAPAQEAASKLAVDYAMKQAEAEEAARKASAERGARQIEREEAERVASRKRGAEERARLAKQEADEEARLARWTGDQILREAEEASRKKAEIARVDAQIQAITAEQTADKIVSEMQRATDALVATFEAKAQEFETLGQAQLDAEIAIRNAMFDTVNSILSAKIEALKDGSKAEKKQAMQLVIAQRAGAVFEIAINTAVAISKALAQLGPIAGGVAAAGITATGVAQTAAVLSEPLPKFYSGGGLGDRVPVGGDGTVNSTLDQREKVANSHTSDLIGPLIDAVNKGFAPLMGGMGGAQAIMVNGRVLGRVVASEARSGGPLGRTIRGGRGVGYNDPYGGRA